LYVQQLDSKWIPVRKSNVKYYRDIELYYKNPAGKIVLYKPEGMDFSDESLQDKPFLGQLYIKPEDKIRCIQAAQRGFSSSLVKNIKARDVGIVKQELVNIIDETLSEPRSGGIKTVALTIDALIDGYSKQPDVIKNLARISHTDYTTTIHSINVMALTIGYGFYTVKSEDEIRDFGLAALLHDLGKTEIPRHILTAPRKLTPEEFDVMKTHPQTGADILAKGGDDIACYNIGCLEHHEKLDGSGYPGGRTSISECGQLLGIIDCYEAITNDDRPYRDALAPLKALELIKQDVDAGKFNDNLFKDFAYSLTDFTKKGHKQKFSALF
jgi:HD-GYP domain-containing protein (c-di-GMP phosphodiesterase class II)